MRLKVKTGRYVIQVRASAEGLSMNRLTQLIITGVISAEVAGWLMVGTMFQFFSVGFSSRFGVFVPVGMLALVGAGTGFMIWAMTRKRAPAATDN